MLYHRASSWPAVLVAALWQARPVIPSTRKDPLLAFLEARSIDARILTVLVESYTYTVAAVSFAMSNYASVDLLPSSYPHIEYSPFSCIPGDCSDGLRNVTTLSDLLLAMFRWYCPPPVMQVPEA